MAQTFTAKSLKYRQSVSAKSVPGQYTYNIFGGMVQSSLMTGTLPLICSKKKTNRVHKYVQESSKTFKPACISVVNTGRQILLKIAVLVPNGLWLVFKVL